MLTEGVVPVPLLGAPVGVGEERVEGLTPLVQRAERVVLRRHVRGKTAGEGPAGQGDGKDGHQGERAEHGE